MTTLIVMFILAGGGGPTVIQGWSSMHACEAAKGAVEAVYKAEHGKTSYAAAVQIKCQEFANNP